MGIVFTFAQANSRICVGKKASFYCMIPIEETEEEIKDDEYVIVLDLHGKEIDSVAFSKHIEECMIRGKSTITFVIGGSLGLGKSLLQRANYRLCFSKMTFPHQLMKLILVEQVYRAFKIMNNQTYHK